VKDERVSAEDIELAIHAAADVVNSEPGGLLGACASRRVY
jgi:hypothetical protein